MCMCVFFANLICRVTGAQVFFFFFEQSTKKMREVQVRRTDQIPSCQTWMKTGSQVGKQLVHDSRDGSRIMLDNCFNVKRPTDGPTDGRTNRRTDGWMDWRTCLNETGIYFMCLAFVRSTFVTCFSCVSSGLIEILSQGWIMHCNKPGNHAL